MGIHQTTGPAVDTDPAAILTRALAWQHRVARHTIDRSGERPWELIGAAVWFVYELADLADDRALRDRVDSWFDTVDEGDDDDEDGRKLLAATEQLVVDLRRAAAFNVADVGQTSRQGTGPDGVPGEALQGIIGALSQDQRRAVADVLSFVSGDLKRDGHGQAAEVVRAVASFANEGAGQ